MNTYTYIDIHISQFLESQETKKINMDDIVAIMTDLLLGGVDTVIKFKYSNKTL